MGGCGAALLHGQVRQEALHLSLAPLSRMPQTLKAEGQPRTGVRMSCHHDLGRGGPCRFGDTCRVEGQTGVLHHSLGPRFEFTGAAYRGYPQRHQDTPLLET